MHGSKHKHTVKLLPVYTEIIVLTTSKDSYDIFGIDQVLAFILHLYRFRECYRIVFVVVC